MSGVAPAEAVSETPYPAKYVVRAAPVTAPPEASGPSKLITIDPALQVPPEHVPEQGLPQNPQLPLSTLVSTQAPLQLVWPVGQHCPFEQVSAALQGLVQLPQCCVSLLRSKHVPLQLVWPVGQHCPFEQASAGLQGLLHLPQFCASLSRKVQVPLQLVSSIGQHAASGGSSGVGGHAALASSGLATHWSQRCFVPLAPNWL
jgi:hypothetical protein